jgi:filamentous hemagglutinin
MKHFEMYNKQMENSVTTRFGGKIKKQLEKRGWSREDVQSTIDKPDHTIPTRDTRYLGSGDRLDDPATAYIDKDGNYVVRNDRTGDIVQLSNRNDPNWKSPFDTQ